MDHYKILGLQRNATKDEIKAAFKKLAFQFHPDKHSQSSKPVRDNATLRFKQVSEAYEVLMDDRKRADYNIGSRSGTSSSRNGFSAGRSSSGYNYYYHYSYKYNYGGNGSTYKHKGRYYKYESGFASKFDPALRFLTLRAFVLSFVFGG